MDLRLLPLSRHAPFPWDSPSCVECRQTTSSQELFLLKTGSAEGPQLVLSEEFLQGHEAQA